MISPMGKIRTKFTALKVATMRMVFIVSLLLTAVTGANHLMNSQNAMTRLKEQINRYIYDTSLPAAHLFICEFIFTSDFKISKDRRTQEVKAKCISLLKNEWFKFYAQEQSKKNKQKKDEEWDFESKEEEKNPLFKKYYVDENDEQSMQKF